MSRVTACTRPLAEPLPSAVAEVSLSASENDEDEPGMATLTFLDDAACFSNITGLNFAMASRMRASRNSFRTIALSRLIAEASDFLFSSKLTAMNL